MTIAVSDGERRSEYSFTLEVVERPPVPPPPWLVLLYLAGDDVPPDATNQECLDPYITNLVAELNRLNSMLANRAMRLVVLADGAGSSLSTRETREALDGAGPIDLLFFDACLIGTIESAYAIVPFASYLVAGQNLLWSRLPYNRYLHQNIL